MNYNIMCKILKQWTVFTNFFKYIELFNNKIKFSSKICAGYKRPQVCRTDPGRLRGQEASSFFGLCTTHIINLHQDNISSNIATYAFNKSYNAANSWVSCHSSFIVLLPRDPVILITIILPYI